MKVKIFLVLLLCTLQQTYGSKSTKKNSRSRLMNWIKYSLIALVANYGAANEIVNPGKPQVAEPNTIGCKYNVPDQNAGVMMEFVKCARNQDFEKYMFDNSKSCPKINKLYKQTENDKKCPFKTPKSIFDGALIRLRFPGISQRDRLSQEANLHMLKEYLLSYRDKNGAPFEYTDNVFRYELHTKYFDFFQFASILELTKFAHPDNTRSAITMALRIYVQEYYSINTDNVKKLYGLTKLMYHNAKTAVVMAFENDHNDVRADNANRILEVAKLAYPDDARPAIAMELYSKYKDVNVANAKKLFQLTKLAYPKNAEMAALMALDNDYKYINADNAGRVLELTKLAYLDMQVAVNEALKPKYKDFNVDKVNKKYQELETSWLYTIRGKQNIMREALKVTYPDFVKDDM